MLASPLRSAVYLPLKQQNTLRNEFRGKTRQRNFHDRRLVAKTAYVAPGTPLKRKRKAGAAVQKPRTFTVELTGGIDILMNKAEETSAFVFEETT